MVFAFMLMALLAWEASSARADSADLEGGVFIVHCVPEFGYSTDPPAGSWCASYLAQAIDNCDAQCTRIDVMDPQPVVWFVLAAWHDTDKEWCGAEFGLGEFNPRIFSFTEHGPCYPESGLQLSTSGWPGPNQGTAFAVMGEPWRGDYQPLYFFRGYAYGSEGPGRIPLSTHPQTGFAGLGNCQEPSERWAAEKLGALGIHMDGEAVCPDAVLGVCCELSFGICYLVPEEECGGLGGIWHTEFTSCDPNPCPPGIMGACCLGHICYFLTDYDCQLMGGEFHQGEDCNDRRVCSPTPATDTNWGAIKAMFRK